MEIETLREKGGGLPVPASFQTVEKSYTRLTSSLSTRKKLLWFIAAAVAVHVGSYSFSVFRRSLEHARVSGSYSSLNPDHRGKLTVQEAEAHFLYSLIPSLHDAILADVSATAYNRSIPNEKNAIVTSKKYATLPHIAGSEQDFQTAKDFLGLLQSELGIPSPSKIPVFDAGSPESQQATRGIPRRHKPSAWIDKYFPGSSYLVI